MCLNYSYLATIINIKSNPIEFLHFICCSAMGSYVKILLLSEKIGMPSKGSQSTPRSIRNSSRSLRSEEPSTQQEPASHQEARNEQEQPVQSSCEHNNMTSTE